MVASPANGLGYKKKFDKAFPNLAKKYDIQLIPFLLDGVALKPELNLSLLIQKACIQKHFRLFYIKVGMT